MAYKAFIDINILVDLLDKERPNHKPAIELFHNAEHGNCLLFVTESVLNTTAYLIRKEFTIRKQKELLFELLTFVEVIPVSKLIYVDGIKRSENDIEDSILYTAALHAKLDYFVTNNHADFKKISVPLLPVISANELLQKHG
jgi:predicted nucleic acid-binding protein